MRATFSKYGKIIAKYPQKRFVKQRKKIRFLFVEILQITLLRTY